MTTQFRALGSSIFFPRLSGLIKISLTLLPPPVLYHLWSLRLTTPPLPLWFLSSSTNAHFSFVFLEVSIRWSRYRRRVWKLVQHWTASDRLCGWKRVQLSKIPFIMLPVVHRAIQSQSNRSPPHGETDSAGGFKSTRKWSETGLVWEGCLNLPLRENSVPCVITEE